MCGIAWKAPGFVGTRRLSNLDAAGGPAGFFDTSLPLPRRTDKPVPLGGLLPCPEWETTAWAPPAYFGREAVSGREVDSCGHGGSKRASTTTACGSHVSICSVQAGVAPTTNSSVPGKRIPWSTRQLE